MGFLPLAAMEYIPLAGIFVGFGLLVVLPVVAILTEHQRKMARILHGQPVQDDTTSVVIGMTHAGGKNNASDNAVLDELRSLRSEVADLRMQVASLQGSNDTVRSRLSQSS